MAALLCRETQYGVGVAFWPKKMPNTINFPL